MEKLDVSRLTSNGGKPMDDCPTDWNWAKAWEDVNNHGKNCNEPRWKFDCGFKLDFDGPLVSINSRFYPPKEAYGPKWDGIVSVVVNGYEIEKSFTEDTLDDLRKVVEEYIKTVNQSLSKWIKSFESNELGL